MKDNITTALTIAKTYLSRFPRREDYGAHLTSSEFDNETTIYHPLTDEEKDIIRKYPKDSDDYNNLGEYLEDIGEKALLEKLFDGNTLSAIDTLDSCDLDDKLKFAEFSIQIREDDGSIRPPVKISCPMSDEQYVELLAQCLLESNRISMNMLVYRKPEIAQRIIRHMVWATYDNQCEMPKPFLCDLDEIKSVSRSILNPAEDILQLFESEDDTLKQFALSHQIEG